jgi:ABC-type glycerol-3-phosphate transport system substrate-binding protein
MIDNSFTKKDDPERNIAVNIRYVAMGLQESVLAGIGPDVANMASGAAVSWGIRNSVEELSRIYTEDDIKNKKNLREGAAVGQEMFLGFSELCPTYKETKEVQYTNSVGKTITEKQLAGEFVVPHAFWNETTKKYEFKDAEGKIDVQFSHAALEAVSLNDKTYLIPTNMNYEMSFYRVDIFAKEGLEPPRTWQELLDVIPKLTTQHMTMGMQTGLPGYQMLLYQMGETMYSPDYCEFTKSKTALEAFETLCDLFNDYSLPIAYDLTRFRTGEIPIVVANWTTYNTFMSYYELRGLWTMESLIGWERVDPNTGELYVDRSSILDVQGIVIPRGADNPQHVWSYIKWYTDYDAQAELARLNLADSALTTIKYNTANLNALLSQAWTSEEVEAMKEQIPHLKGLPFNPGDYNISRYISFAFLAVYNSNANAVDNFLDHVVDINKELTRKRKEYHLPTIEDREESSES